MKYLPFFLLFLPVLLFGQTNSHFKKADSLADQKKFQEALVEIDLAIREDSLLAQYHLRKFSYLLALERYEDALRGISLAMEWMPDSAHLYDARGVLFEASQYYDEAIEDFTQASRHAENPEEKAHFLMNRGGVKAKVRDFQGAYQDLNYAYKLDSTNIDVLNNLATVCDEIGQKNLAIRYLESILEIDPKYLPAYVNLGFAYQAEDNHKKAILYFNKAIELDPNEALGYSNRSFSKLKTGDLNGAMEDIDRSIELFPTNSYAYKVRALIKIERGHTKPACEDLQKALELGYTRSYGNEVLELMKQYCK
ncbi:MAG: tetratricopeptide repeat protein [Lewinellaceae bacterium]|nr:tetratricopeptide repeat protein [Lewinellaceae bacterium]